MRFWLGALRLSCILHDLFRDPQLDHVWRALICAPNTLNRSKTIISKDKGKGHFQNRVHGVLLQQLSEHSWRFGLSDPVLYSQTQTKYFHFLLLTGFQYTDCFLIWSISDSFTVLPTSDHFSENCLLWFQESMTLSLCGIECFRGKWRKGIFALVSVGFSKVLVKCVTKISSKCAWLGRLRPTECSCGDCLCWCLPPPLTPPTRGRGIFTLICLHGDE